MACFPYKVGVDLLFSHHFETFSHINKQVQLKKTYVRKEIQEKEEEYKSELRRN